MIELVDVHKGYKTKVGYTPVLKGLNLVIKPGEKIGIVGRNGAGKSTLIRLISGVDQPDSGAINRLMSISWPLAFGGGFVASLTGMDNLRFICRIYGVDPDIRKEYVEDFAELGKYFYEPIKKYSSGMRARLAFAISMAIEFDCFLIDEIVAVGDQRFRDRCHYELFERRADRAMVIVSHDMNYVKATCDRAALLDGGHLIHYDSIEEAYADYHDRFH